MKTIRSFHPCTVYFSREKFEQLGSLLLAPFAAVVGAAMRSQRLVEDRRLVEENAEQDSERIIEEESTEENMLNTSDHNVNLETEQTKQMDIKELMEHVEVLTKEDTPDDHVRNILQDLIYRQLSIDHLLRTKLGRTVRKLRSRPGPTGTLISLQDDHQTEKYS